MREYRIYPVDRTGHIFGPAMIIDSDTDSEAIISAISVAQDNDGVAAEVWVGNRMVCRVPSSGAPWF